MSAGPDVVEALLSKVEDLMAENDTLGKALDRYAARVGSTINMINA